MGFAFFFKQAFYRFAIVRIEIIVVKHHVK